MMDKSDQAFENRYALFFDFLGTSHAARKWPQDRVHNLVDLLISLAGIQSAQDISGNAEADGGYRMKITPEITTFSDNIVVSYPGVPDEADFQPLDPLWAKIICEDSIRILSGVAEMALRIGVLIRGGLSYGQLYHEGGVTFGEAMVDAYELENDVAKTPRVVVSDRVIGKLEPSELGRKSVLLQDTDGVWHLDYFTKMAKEGMRLIDGKITNPGWATHHLDSVQKQIEALRGRADAASLGHAAKWGWFKRSLEEAIKKLTPLA
jgi:hypothetical protein